MRYEAVIGVLAALAMLLGPAGSAAACTQTEEPVEGTGTQGMADAVTLTVRVVYSFIGGAPPPPGIPVRRSERPASGLTVRAIPAGDGTAAPVAEGTTDDNGTVALSVPPGSYWVYVPRPAPGQGGITGTAGLSALPDDTTVLQWGSVALAPGAQESITLEIELAAP